MHQICIYVIEIKRIEVCTHCSAASSCPVNEVHQICIYVIEIKRIEVCTHCSAASSCPVNEENKFVCMFVCLSVLPYLRIRECVLYELYVRYENILPRKFDLI